MALNSALPGHSGASVTSRMRPPAADCNRSNSASDGACCGAAAVAAYGLPLKLNILLAIVLAVLLCLLLESTMAPATVED